MESGKDINKIYITKGEKHGSITKIIAKAKERKIVTVEVEREKINQMAQTENAQGVIAIVPPFDYCEVEDILNEAKSRNEKAFILILDGIEDPHNLGSIIRTAETAGVHGIIIPKRRAAAVNSTVVKTSAGATSFMKVARENNSRLGTDARFIKSDLFESVTGKYDMIVSNPPYIRTEEINRLDEEVKLHDPWIALDGKEDGLYFYRLIVKDSIRYLNKGGYILFEIGFDQGKDVSELLKNEGYEEIEIKKDLAGLDRVVMGRYNKE